MKFFTLSDKGNVRPNNEDFVEGVQMTWSGPIGSPQTLTALILADGMGGAAAGEFASLLAVRTVRSKLINGLLNQPPEELLSTDLKAFLVNSYEEANQVIYNKGHEEADFQGMGTTIVSILIHKDMMTVGHVGDSRGYLFRNGKLNRMTRDHSLVQELVDEGKITPQEALIHPNRNVITQALGVDIKVKPDCERMPILPGDLVLLCSDGLTGYSDESAIKKNCHDALEGPVDLAALADRLIQLAKLGGGGDNISVALYYHPA